MKAKHLLLAIAFIATLSACIKSRDIEIPNNTKQNSSDTITTGTLLVNEVGCRWTTSILSEYQEYMIRRHNSLAGTPNATDYPNGQVKWFEVYNNSKDTIDFSKGGWYFTDIPGSDTGNIKQPVVSSLKLAPKAMAAVYADTFINNPAQTQLHIGFGLSRYKSKLGIFYKNPVKNNVILVDTTTYPDGINNKTWSRIPDGNTFFFQSISTPNAPNQQ
jgi:hypothetical protein